MTYYSAAHKRRYTKREQRKTLGIVATVLYSIIAGWAIIGLVHNLIIIGLHTACS